MARLFQFKTMDSDLFRFRSTLYQTLRYVTLQSRAEILPFYQKKKAVHQKPYDSHALLFLTEYQNCYGYMSQSFSDQSNERLVDHAGYSRAHRDGFIANIRALRVGSTTINIIIFYSLVSLLHSITFSASGEKIVQQPVELIALVSRQYLSLSVARSFTPESSE